jgi:hypothetical protein
LRGEYIVKIGKESKVLQEEMRLFGRESQVIVLSPTRMRRHLASIDRKHCIYFLTFLLKWLNSTYVESLREVKEFEEPVLTKETKFMS